MMTINNNQNGTDNLTNEENPSPTHVAQIQKTHKSYPIVESYHLNNHNVIGYQKYLSHKKEGRWLVFSLAAFISQPLFLFFNKMYFEFTLYAIIAGFLFGYNFFYGLIFCIFFSFIAFKLYELHADRLYITSISKFLKFQKKYKKQIDENKILVAKRTLIQNNPSLNDKKKNKELNQINSSVQWNYLMISPETYFFDKIKPISFISLFPTVFFVIIPSTLVFMWYFSMNNKLGAQIIEVFNNEFTTTNLTGKASSKEELEQLKYLNTVNNLAPSLYYFNEKYVEDSLNYKLNGIDSDYRKKYQNYLNNTPNSSQENQQ